MTATAALFAVPFIWRRFGRGYAAIVVLGLAAAAVVRPVRRPRPLLLGAVPAADPAGLPERRNAPPGLMAGFVLFYTLGLVLFGNVHPLF